MDAIDRNIISHLQQHGRMTNVELARLNELAPSSMLERVRRLEDKGIIKGYRAVLDPKSLGYAVQAMVMINLDRHQAGPIDEFEDKIRAVPEVKSCWHLAGRYDYMVHLVVRDIDHLGTLVKHVLADMKGVEKQETFLVLSTTKHDEGYCVESMAPISPEE
jgi:Lrp/AsnC family leucine-responsive transcriptional regulator